MNFHELAINARILSSLIRRRPVFLLYHPSYSCNFACRMCGIRDREPNISVAETLARARRLRPLLKQAGVGIVNIGGGEPLLFPAITDLIRLFAHDFLVRVQTNGMLATKTKVAEVAAAGLSGVSLSLHSLREEVHDEICGTSGAYAGVRTAIENFVAEPRFRWGMRILNTVITRCNWRELPDLARFAASHNFYMAFVPLLPSVPEPGNYTYRSPAEELVIPPAEYEGLKAVLDELFRMRRSGVPIFNSAVFFPQAYNYLSGNARSWLCDAGRLYFVMNAQGRISPCTEIPPGRELIHREDLTLMRNGGPYYSSCSTCMHPCFWEISQSGHHFLAFYEGFRRAWALKKN